MKIVLNTILCAITVMICAAEGNWFFGNHLSLSVKIVWERIEHQCVGAISYPLRLLANFSDSIFYDYCLLTVYFFSLQMSLFFLVLYIYFFSLQDHGSVVMKIHYDSLRHHLDLFLFILESWRNVRKLSISIFCHTNEHTLNYILCEDYQKMWPIKIIITIKNISDCKLVFT